MNRTVFTFAAALIALATASTASATALEYTAGHGDIRPVFQESQLRLLYGFDRTAVLNGSPLGGTSSSLYFYDPEDVYVRVPDATGLDFDALTTAQKNARAFLGIVPDGTSAHDFWLLPIQPVTGVPYFGLSTQSATSSLGWSGSFTWKLTDFSGPVGGYASLYTTNSFGAMTALFDTFDGIGSDDSFTMSLNTHAHYFWAFTQPGIYEMEITATGTRSAAGGGGTYSATETFLFAVTNAVSIPEPNSMMLLAIGAIGLLTKRKFQQL